MLVIKSFEGTKYNLSTKSEHIIGRHGSDLEIKNDDSISRQHVSIKILVKKSKFCIELCDTGSKHGTFINESIETQNKLPKGVPVALNIGDKIRFGLRLNIWTLLEEEFVICAPSPTAHNTAVMNKLLAKLKGKVITDWSKQCTHLTVDEIKMDTKVVCALAYAKPIVTFDYWKQLLATLTSRKEQPIPNYTEFIPPVVDILRCSGPFDYSINTLRRSLFKNYQFIAFGKDQYTRVLPLVEAAGGKITDGTVSKMTLEQLTCKNVIVLQVKNVSQKKVMETCLDLLKKQKRRAINEAEICLSIAECSTNRYCNPAYDVETLFKQEIPAVNDDATILVEDTQNLREANADPQELGTGSNFSLNVHDQNRALSDDDDFVVQDSPPIVEECSSTRSGVKRKLKDASERSSVKNSKLDSFVIRQKASDGDDSELPNSSRSNTLATYTKDVFSFHNMSKTTVKSSGKSLFAGVRDRVKQKSSSSFDTNSGESSNSLIPDSLKRSCQETDTVQPKRSMRSSFAKPNIGSSDIESVSLFSSHTENAGGSSSPRIGNKRKLMDPEPIPSTSKKPNRSFSLFESSRTKKGNAIISVDSDDEVDSALNREASKLTISKSPRRNVTTPVIDVPTTVNLSQFLEAHGPKYEIKREPDSNISSDIKDVMNNTVLHSVSLIKTKNTATAPERVYNSEINFKKFRKNNCAKVCNIIPITSLVRYEAEQKNEF